MDYGPNDSLVRLQNVINGDTSGISKSVNWLGGGSFIYCELKTINQIYAVRTQLAKNEKELWDIWQQMHTLGFVDNPAHVKGTDKAAENYKLLPFGDLKKLFIDVLDKNMHYVNLCDIEDEDFEVSEKEKEFTWNFYGKG